MVMIQIFFKELQIFFFFNVYLSLFLFFVPVLHDL